MDTNEKPKFYQTTWFTVIMLIFFCPVGLILMWRQNKFNKAARIIISIFCGIVLIGMVSGDSNKSPAPTASDNVTATQSESAKDKPSDEPTKKAEPKEVLKTQPEKPKFNVAAMEITKENIAIALKDIIPADKYKGAEITVEKGMTIVDVYFNPGDAVWDEEDIVKQSARKATDSMEVLFKNPKIDKIWFWTQTTMLDAKGNESIQEVINVSLTKENAKDINWPKFKDMVMLDYHKLFNIADSHYIHPGILNNID